MENGEFKYNLMMLKSFLDRKYNDILDSIDSQCSLDFLSSSERYIISLERIIKAILERRKQEIAIKTSQLGLKEMSEGDRKDLEAIEQEIESKALLRKRVFYMQLFVRFKVVQRFDQTKEKVQAGFESGKHYKHILYKKTFEKFGQRGLRCGSRGQDANDGMLLIKNKPLFIQLIMRDAGVQTAYPFQGKQELFGFLSEIMSPATMDFMILYLLLDIFGTSILEPDSKMLREIKNLPAFGEFVAYWYIDNAFRITDESSNEIAKNLTASLKYLFYENDYEIQYSAEILQAFHELDSEPHIDILRGASDFLIKIPKID